MQVQVRNVMFGKRYNFEQPELHNYQGEETKPKWLSESQLALSVNDPNVSLRIFDRNNIVSIDGKPYHYVSKTDKIFTKIVVGSKGNEYTVTWGSKKHCTCPGFTFRGDCKHVKEMV
jgi:SWIM zinc finger